MPAQQPSGALPLYLQISEMLIRDIASGRLPRGTHLPPEREMAKSLDTSEDPPRRKGSTRSTGWNYWRAAGCQRRASWM